MTQQTVVITLTPSGVCLECQGSTGNENCKSVAHGSNRPSTTSQVLCDLYFQRQKKPGFTFLYNETWWLSENFENEAVNKFRD